MHFYDMEKFCDFFTLRPSDLNITLTYVLMDNFCPCFISMQTLILIVKIYIYFKHTVGEINIATTKKRKK